MAPAEAGADLGHCFPQVGSLANPRNRFKVDVNATENHLTGVVLISDSFSVVIVEGGEHTRPA